MHIIDLNNPKCVEVEIIKETAKTVKFKNTYLEYTARKVNDWSSIFNVGAIYLSDNKDNLIAYCREVLKNQESNANKELQRVKLKIQKLELIK